MSERDALRGDVPGHRPESAPHTHGPEEVRDSGLGAGRRTSDFEERSAGSVGRLEGLSHRADLSGTEERTIELREEELIAHKDLRELGEVEIRTEIEEVPGRLQVDAYHEEVEVEHVPVGEVVQERRTPWEEGDAIVVPIYEEQLVVVKRLILREQLRIRRVGTTETRLFEDTLRRERIVVEDPNRTGLVHEQFPTQPGTGREPGDRPADEDRARHQPSQEEGGFLGQLRKAFQ